MNGFKPSRRRWRVDDPEGDGSKYECRAIRENHRLFLKPELRYYDKKTDQSQNEGRHANGANPIFPENVGALLEALVAKFHKGDVLRSMLSEMTNGCGGFKFASGSSQKRKAFLVRVPFVINCARTASFRQPSERRCASIEPLTPMCQRRLPHLTGSEQGDCGIFVEPNLNRLNLV